MNVIREKGDTRQYDAPIYCAPISRNGASLTCQSGRPGMADPRNSRVSSPENYFPHAVRRAFPPQLKLKHKKCAPPRPRCVYMHDRCAYVLVERGGASIYGSLTHHLLQIQARFIDGIRGGRGNGEYREWFDVDRNYSDISFSRVFLGFEFIVMNQS